MNVTTVSPSVLTDLDVCKGFWDSAVAYQKLNSLPNWYDFPTIAISQEIRDNQHFTVRQGNVILGYVSVTYSDPLIWEDLEDGRSIYLHRMCVNPDHRGKHLASIALRWACAFAKVNKKDFVRIDTWASNERLIDYYVRSGFKPLAKKRPTDPKSLPPHYNNIELMLFQNSCI
jgi:ribosomal protein S18 acetylase RimI-like enzyme